MACFGHGFRWTLVRLKVVKQLQTRVIGAAFQMDPRAVEGGLDQSGRSTISGFRWTLVRLKAKEQCLAPCRSRRFQMDPRAVEGTLRTRSAS